jgi:hypothetical protein
MKHIKHWYLELLPNKTVVMVIKTFEEGVKYKIDHPGMIEVGESNNIDEWRECIVQVPTCNAFWKEELTFMQYSSVQNKDEIRIYYTPVPASYLSKEPNIIYDKVNKIDKIFTQKIKNENDEKIKKVKEILDTLK